MEYSVGDKIIFNKKYINLSKSSYTAINSIGWVEPWLIGRTATIIGKVPIGVRSQYYWYYIDISSPTRCYDEALFSKLTDTTEVLVEL